MHDVAAFKAAPEPVDAPEPINEMLVPDIASHPLEGLSPNASSAVNSRFSTPIVLRTYTTDVPVMKGAPSLHALYSYMVSACRKVAVWKNDMPGRSALIEVCSDDMLHTSTRLSWQAYAERWQSGHVTCRADLACLCSATEVCSDDMLHAL